MNPQVMEFWDKGLTGYRNAEEKINSDEEPEIVIDLLKNSVASAITAITLMKSGETDLAFSDLCEFGEEIKNCSLRDALRTTKKTLKRMHDLAPRDCYLPEP